MGVQNPRSSLGSKKYKNQEEKILTKSTKNPKKLLFFYANADNMINKRNRIQLLVSTNNPVVFCTTKTLPKNVLVKIEECEFQIDWYDCFSNINNSNLH